MKNEEPIRIAHVVGKMVGGGLESFLMTFYKEIDKEKIQFDFIVDSDSSFIPEEEILNNGGNIIKVSPYQNIFSYIRDIRGVLKKGKYKIVHSHMNSLSVFPLYAAWREKVPVRIAHSHSTTNRKEWKKNLLKCILKPFSKIFATHFFACSEHAGKWLFGKRIYKNGKINIVRNAIDTEKFKYDITIRDRIRKELDVEDKYVVGHVGRFVQQKNQTFLIDIFSKVHEKKSNAILLLIGQGPLENEIRKKVDAMGLSKYVRFLGQINNVNEIMQAMDCFVFPSLYEGLGIVAVEAQCSGLKCICSLEVPEETKISKLFEYCDFNDIDRWIKCILDNNSIREDQSFLLKNVGYEITDEVKRIEDFYMNL